MKRYLLLFSVLICHIFNCTQFVNSQINNEAEFDQHKFIIKLKADSPNLKSIQNGGVINLFDNGIIGNFSIKRLIRPELLDKFYSINNDKSNKLQSPSNKEDLRNLYIIEYSTNISPIVVASKYKKHPDLEYIEPFFKRSTQFFPNDTLFPTQSWLRSVKADSSWDLLNTSDTLLLTICDTGVDYTHFDLASNVFINQGEWGKDQNGNDKSTNGIDDDKNGFIDDYHGWDFVSTQNPTIGDNDPMPGNRHGTHVSGIADAVGNNIAGIAGIARNVKILPCKVGDDQGSSSIQNQYEALLYPAIMGSKVVNCSWGGGGYSQAEQDIINNLVSKDLLIVAAAGNNYSNQAFYPAAYFGVLSVAATDTLGQKVDFSNYDGTVSVSAPGLSIFSTFPGGNFGYSSGTSMASPVVAGVAAMARLKFPKYNPLQMIEFLKQSTDNTDSLNPNYIFKLGTGKINAMKALTDKKMESVLISNYSFVEEVPDLVISKNERIYLNITLQNIFDNNSNLSLKASYFNLNPNTRDSIFFYKNELKNFSISQNGKLEIDSAVSFEIMNNIALNKTIEIKIDIFNSNGKLLSYKLIRFIANPSFRTLLDNNIHITLNSLGNFAFNDYPSNEQGIGFTYKNSNNLLFEGSLMVGLNDSVLSNVARGKSSSKQDKDFILNTVTNTTKSIDQYTECNTIYNDLNPASQLPDSSYVGVIVAQKVIQPTESLYSNFIITTYKLINKSNKVFDSLFVGLYFDWDIGDKPDQNKVSFDNDNSLGIVKNIGENTPQVGMIQISNFPINFYAIDNSGAKDDTIQVSGGFTRREKWVTLSSGVKRKESNVTDISTVISAGPIWLKSGDSTVITFALLASEDEAGLINSTKLAREYAIIKKLTSIGGYEAIPNQSEINEIYPSPISPSSEKLNFVLALSDPQDVEIYICDQLGRNLKTIKQTSLPAGQMIFKENINYLNNGIYYLVLKSRTGISAKKFVVFE